MRSGDIMKQTNNETDESIYERLKQALLDIRGPTSTDWSRILEIKQENEPFETYAERLWTTYKEYSGLENASRDHKPLLQLIKNNAGNSSTKCIVKRSRFRQKHVQSDCRLGFKDRKQMEIKAPNYCFCKVVDRRELF